MRLLDRYLLRELLVPLGFCLAGFLVFWIASDLFVQLGDLQRKGMGATDIAEYYVVKLPEFLALVLPIALLLALLYALTNHARHHEITAIRAAGVSLWRLSLPYLGVGLLASLALFATNELWMPWSDELGRAIERRHQAPNPQAPRRNEHRNLYFENTRDARRWRIGSWNTATGEMIEPEVSPTQRSGTQLWQLKAKRGQVVDGLWTFYDARVLKDAADSNGPPVLTLQTNVLVVPEFGETREEINSEIKIRESMTLRGAKKADVPIKDLVNFLRLHPQPTRSDWYWLHTKLEGRLAAPWTCLVVVLIALPFGAAGGRRNVYVGVASSIVICFSYVILQQIGLALGTSGRIEPWLAAWFPNMAFGLAGFCLTARVR